MENNTNIFFDRDIPGRRVDAPWKEMIGHKDYLVAMGYAKPTEDISKEDAIERLKTIGLTPMDGVLNYEDPMLLRKIKEIMEDNVAKAEAANIGVHHDYYPYEEGKRHEYPLQDFGMSTSDWHRTPVDTGVWYKNEEVPIYWTNWFTGNETNEPPPKWLNWAYDEVVDWDKGRPFVNVPMTPSLDNLLVQNEEIAHARNALEPEGNQRQAGIERVGPLAEMMNQIYEEIDAKDKAYRATLYQLGLPPTSRLTPDADKKIDYTFASYMDALRHRIRDEQENYDQSNDNLIKDAYDFYDTTPEKFATQHLPNILYPWWNNEDYYNFEPVGDWNPHARRWLGVEKSDIQYFPEPEYLDEYIYPSQGLNKLGEGYFSKNYVPPQSSSFLWNQ